MTRLPNQLPEHPYALEIPALESALETNSTHGLSDAKVIQRHEQYGRNKLPDPNSRKPIAIFLSQFKSTLVLILTLAAIISFFYHHYLDVYIILFIIITNAIVGFFQEYKAERSIEALKQLVIQQATVIRDGKNLHISCHELVPGDIILLSEGDQVPADARLITVSNLQTNESTLTGESLPIEKSISTLESKTAIGDQINMVHMGTSVTRGSGTAIVTATGSNTTLGGIAGNLKDIEEGTDHFKIKTNELGKQMGVIAVVSTSLIFIVGYFIRGFSFDEIFMFSVASLVSAIPEGLPVILTIVLALSAKRMAMRGAIVRRLSATETLAIIDTIITDKTGTLTQNKMTVTTLALPYQPNISVTSDSHKTVFLQDKTHPTKAHYPLQKLLDIASMCHGVRREFDAGGKETFSGDPTEIALVTLADAATHTNAYHRRPMTQIDDLPFHQDYRWRCSLVKYHELDSPQMFVVGAPETVLAQCTRILMPDHKPHPITEEHKQALNQQLLLLSNKGIRVLAAAYKPARLTTQFDHDHVEELVFSGFIGMVDPPRSEAITAIAAAHTAGINVIMATGDHPITAKAIGLELGLITADNPDQQIITESEFETLSDADIIARMDTIHIYARMTPSNKLRLTHILQSQGKVIAMTGDGVNDAPALKKADIGISMGKNGTDVAREASDIILADDNFATIVAAIEEGRTQLRNIRRTSFFLITTNLAETIGLVVFLLLGLPLPFLAKQILWLNLVTAGVTDMALATEPIHEDVLNTPPKSSKEPILNRQVIPFLIIVTGSIIILTLATFLLYLPKGLTEARTAAFVMLSVTQIINVLNLRSLKKSVFRIGMFSNRNVNYAIIISLGLLLSALYLPWLNHILELTTIPLGELISISLIASITLWLSELYKKVAHLAK